jgi:hypothetical protein
MSPFLYQGLCSSLDEELLGFFDRGSFDEVMCQWARTVVVGRARLGGIPMGVIAVETRPIELQLPADPANPDSEAKILSQAGQVWFPDSAYKTAQAIYDFGHEELPLMVFANWRGFSGGMKDMYEQVVKFGAMIVDALRQYTRPIFVYIPPFAELRGGSWVVIDPSINSRQMEMYADPNARGGVLEAEGTVSIKLRMKEQRLMMDRLDPEMRKLSSEARCSTTSEERRRELEEALRKREEVLAPTYHQVAVHFAELHDTPTRMKEKAVIREVVEWSESRTFFYWRLRRRLLESQIVAKMEASTHLKYHECLEMLRHWFIEDQGENQRFLWDQDRSAVEWLTAQTEQSATAATVVQTNLEDLRRHSAALQLKALLEANPDLPDSLLVKPKE